MTKHRRPRFSTAARAIALTAPLLALAGCPSTPNLDAPPPPSKSASQDIGVETRFPWGAYREDLENRYGSTKLHWVKDEVPDDEFAAAAMREMVAARKPRPTYYQVFTTRRLDGQGFFRDYVFYNTQNRVIYAVRRG